MSTRAGNLRKPLQLAAIATALFLFGMLAVFRTGILDQFELVMLDNKFRYLQREDPNNRIAIVSIDEKSLNYFAQNRNFWPWPREFYQLLTDYLHSSGARLVVFDILFDTPDYDRRSVSGSSSDKRFARSLQKTNIGILAFKSSPGQAETPLPDSIYRAQLGYQVAGNAPWQSTPHIYTSLPIPPFAANARAFGNTVVNPDDDAVIRRVHLLDSLDHHGFVPNLAMSAYLELQTPRPQLKWEDQYLQIGDLEVPIQRDGSYLINWYKKGGVSEGTFPYYSFSAVIQSAINRLRNPEAEVPVPPELLEDKVIFIGASAAGLADIKSTPMSSLEPFPGVEIHANVLNNLLDRQFLTQPSELQNGLVLALLIVLIVGFIAYQSLGRDIIFSIALLLGILVIGTVLFAQFRIWIPTGHYLLLSTFTIFATIAYKYFSEEKQKRYIRSAFTQYVQPEFVEEIIDRPETLKLGGQKRQMTVMFSDLAGFTTLSESMEPEALVSFLNEYLDAMTRIIFDHRGTVDKYIGDAIMAFWGAPVPQEQHATLACRSTLEMIRTHNRLIEQWGREGKPTAIARYGVNSGPMIVGNMGSANRFNYTVIGDAVNLGARLEPANKVYDTLAMISQHTKNRIGEEFVTRQLDLMIVKGKTEPVAVYELMADRAADRDCSQEIELATLFNQGIEQYLARRWDEAITTFEKALEQNPDDRPSKLYIERCQNYLTTPPDAEWNGVFEMKTK